MSNSPSHYATNSTHHLPVFVDAFAFDADHDTGRIESKLPPRRRSYLAAGLLVFTVAALVAGAALASDYHSNPWLLSWIPPACCVTNDCCWEIQERDLEPLPGDRWRVLSTGQVRLRTDWSPDGKFYRCACDYTGTQWIKHQGANTRCLFVPLRAAQLHLP